MQTAATSDKICFGSARVEPGYPVVEYLPERNKMWVMQV